MSMLIQKNDKKRVCLKETAVNIILIIWIAFLTTATVIRCFYGVEMTDEAFYVSEAVSVIRGNTPYAYVMGRTAGFTFIMLPFVKVYSLLFPGLEGLFVYTRLLFAVFRLFIFAVAYRLLKHHYNNKYLKFVLSLFIPVSGISIPNFSYNTISVWLFFLTGVVQLWGFKSTDDKDKYKGAVCSAILVAFAEMAHPGQILNVFWFGITYWICYKKERMKCFLLYAGSGIVTVLSILTVLAVQTSPTKLIFGFETIFNWTNANAPYLTAQEQLWNVYQSAKWEFEIFIYCMLAYLVIWMLRMALKQMKVGKKFKLFGCMEKILGQIEFIDSLSLAVILCSVRLFREGNAQYNPYYLGAAGAILTAVCGMAILKRNAAWVQGIVPLLMLFPFFQFIVTGLFTDSTAFYRLEPFVFSIFGFGILLEKYFKENILWKQIFVIVTLSGVCLLVLYNNYNFMYRDEPISMLDTKVDKGVYKNIYTTSVRAKSVIELEEYIREHTQKGEKVLFMDLAPMAYFMTDAIPWTPSTWDRMQYAYGFNQPEIVYRYFQNRGDIPDKIIYIDSGRDECLSIDAEGYLFNDFVNENYTLTAEDNLNEMFSTKMYTLLDNVNE